EGGLPRAYLNECQHLAIPLGGRSGRLLTEDGKSLICRTHGALYRLTDGFCTEGPCLGTHLAPLALEEDEDGVLWIIDDEQDAGPDTP
ncbi:MAG: Rieske 2Fe-2S domain-containing protein, partial [Deltaproteobacteria bacterium]|nr:Rieske 2Fe-2S domain-containing protein [Deltaproteobacteria bacterium]